MKIPNWTSHDGVWLPNSANGLSIPEPKPLRTLKDRFGEIMIFPSSGTGGAQPKWVVLVKSNWINQSKSLLSSLKLDQVKTWGNLLPTFHVGGCGVYIRAHLTQAKVLSFSSPWHPERAYDFLVNNNIEVTSLVPTQIYDLLSKAYPAPPALRSLLVGGANLSEPLKDMAQTLGWPLLLTFGMTETNAFFACQQTGQQGYWTLPGYQIKAGADHGLLIKSPYLFEGYLQENQFIPKPLNKEGFWQAPDKINLNSDGSFRTLGRSQSDYVKIKGEGVSLSVLRDKLQSHLDTAVKEPWELFTCECERRGAKIIIVYGGHSLDGIMPVIESWNQNCSKFEQIELVSHLYSMWPKTSVGKIHLSALRALVCQLDPIKSLRSN